MLWKEGTLTELKNLGVTGQTFNYIILASFLLARLLSLCPLQAGPKAIRSSIHQPTVSYLLFGYLLTDIIVWPIYRKRKNKGIGNRNTNIAHPNNFARISFQKLPFFQAQNKLGSRFFSPNKKPVSNRQTIHVDRKKKIIEFETVIKICRKSIE